jgi:hypothetical protein
MLLFQYDAQHRDHVVKFRLRDVLAGVHFLHRIAGVVARATAQIADLLCEQRLDAAQIGSLEASAKRGICRHAIDQHIGNVGDAILAAQPLVEADASATCCNADKSSQRQGQHSRCDGCHM